MPQALKTLSFQGEPIYYLADATGTNWVLIRPICEALGIDAERQIKNLQEDEILAPERAEQTVQVPEQTLAPEHWVHGVQLPIDTQYIRHHHPVFTGL